MKASPSFFLAVFALVAFPLSALAGNCTLSETKLLVKGEEFDTIPIQLRAGAVRVGSMDFVYVGDEVGWQASRPAEAAVAAQAPATQVTLDKTAIEIRSLDRHVGSSPDTPDVVVTARSGAEGPEIEIAAVGSAMLDTEHKARGLASRNGLSRHLSLDCTGLKSTEAPIAVSANP